MKPIYTIIALLVLNSFAISVSQATTISYQVANISGNTWQYDYKVTNDMLSFDIEEFTIFFGLGLYENLSSPSAPADWDPLVIQPDLGLPDDGFYDALALTSGIAPGDMLGTFSVQFDFLGTGTPGSQPFEIVDPLTSATLDSGDTQLASNGNPIPEPAMFWLIFSGIGLLACQQKRLKTP